MPLGSSGGGGVSVPLGDWRCRGSPPPAAAVAAASSRSNAAPGDLQLPPLGADRRPSDGVALRSLAA